MNNVQKFPGTTQDNAPRAGKPARRALPDLLADIAGSSLEHMEALLTQVFGEVDDKFFGLAEKARSDAEQNLFFEALREVRVKRPGIEKKFREELNNAFYRINDRTSELSAATAGEPEDLQLQSLDKLSLVADEELEVSLAYSTMISRAEDRLANGLVQLSTRLNNYLGVNTVDEETNPLGPRVVCAAIKEACAPLDLEIKTRLVFLKIFENAVIAGLDAICQEANALLIKAGILPDFEGYVRKHRTARSQADGQRAAPPIQDGQHTEATTNPVNQSMEQYGSLDTRALLLLQQLLGVSSTAEGTQNNQTLQQGPSPGLLAMLNSAQSNLVTGQRQSAPAMGGINLITALEQLSGGEGQLESNINDVEREVINLVSMLFDFILRDRNLAEPMKLLITQLQIPMVKAGLLDKALFSKNAHPARKLLNEIASVSVGWDETDQLEKDPLWKKISGIVEEITQGFADDISIFHDKHRELLEFVEDTARKARLIEQRMREEEEGKARAAEARFMVHKIINRYAVGRKLPGVIVKLLRDHWSKVMFHVHLTEGSNSDLWKTVVDIVKKLIWSVQDKSSTEQMVLVYKKIPSIYSDLRSGLQHINCSQAQVAEIFCQLNMLYFDKDIPDPLASHLGQAIIERIKEIEESGSTLSILSIGSDPQTPDSGPRDNDSAPANDELKDHKEENAVTIFTLLPEEKRGDVADETAAPDSADVDSDYFKLVDSIDIGDWISYTPPGDKAIRCKLALRFDARGRHIFVDRRGMKVLERCRFELAQDFQAGHCERLDDEQLFDRALESVISNLYEERSGLAR